MNQRIQVWAFLLALIVYCPLALSQVKPKPPRSSKAPSAMPQNVTQQRNIEEYIELIRSNVRQEKAQVLGAVMDLSAGEAAKFWPIYSEYDEELIKLNKMRSDNIQEYARVYAEMSDTKADELISKAIEYQRQRSELLARYYGRVKESIGAIQAARFIQIENQLLMIIDLQIASNLPLFEASDTSRGGKQ